MRANALADLLVVHPGLRHVADVAEHRQSAELALGQQSRPRRLLVAALGQLDLPGVRRGQLALDELAPQLGLVQRRRLRAGDPQGVAQLHRLLAAVVLGELVLVELAERLAQPLLTCLASGSSLLSFQ